MKKIVGLIIAFILVTSIVSAQDIRVIGDRLEDLIVASETVTIKDYELKEAKDGTQVEVVKSSRLYTRAQLVAKRDRIVDRITLLQAERIEINDYIRSLN